MISSYVKILNYIQAIGLSSANSNNFQREKVVANLPQKVNVLALLSITTQVLSAAAFIESVIINEVKNYGAYKSPLYVEPFSAVGQWSTVAILGLVNTAAVVSKVSERPDQAGEIHDGYFQGDEESLKDGWIGYAS